MIILTRDADFTHLRQPLMKKIKVVYIRLIGDPNKIAQQVLNNRERCTNTLQDHNAVMLDEEGLHAL